MQKSMQRKKPKFHISTKTKTRNNFFKCKNIYWENIICLLLLFVDLWLNAALMVRNIFLIFLFKIFSKKKLKRKKQKTNKIHC